jgi:hypothetical protein
MRAAGTITAKIEYQHGYLSRNSEITLWRKVETNIGSISAKGQKFCFWFTATNQLCGSTDLFFRKRRLFSRG